MDKLCHLPEDQDSNWSTVEKRVFEAIGKISKAPIQDNLKCKDVLMFVLIPSIAFMLSELSPFQNVKIRVGVFVGVLILGIAISKLL